MFVAIRQITATQKNGVIGHWHQGGVPNRQKVDCPLHAGGTRSLETCEPTYLSDLAFERKKALGKHWERLGAGLEGAVGAPQIHVSALKILQGLFP